ncbi:MAG: hypothetical protein IT285_04360 [Bdellovibrionales bacterium]|nr:hypothetical protein [Bdellovibrionales bacterium]
MARCQRSAKAGTIRGLKHFVFRGALSLAAAALMLAPTPLHAISDTGAPVGSLFGELPPSFLSGTQAALGADMTACLLGQFTNAGGAMMGTAGVHSGFLDTMAGAGRTFGSWSGAACPAPGEIPQNPSCQEVQEGTRFSPSRLEALRARVTNSRDALVCQTSKMASLQSELGCLQRQAQTLSQQIASLQGAYTQNIQSMQTHMGRLQDLQKGREFQLEEVGKFLNGDPATGRTGLLQLEQETEALLNAMPEQIQQREEAFRQIEDQQRVLEETKVTRTAGLAQQCFNERVQPNYRCGRTGEAARPTNAKAYLLCRYEQEMTRMPSGRVERENRGVANNARNQAAALEALLNQIFADAPNNPNLPGGSNPQQFMEQAEQFSNQPMNVLSLADIENRYGDALRGFNSNGVDVHGFIIRSMSGCFSRANQQVRREERREGTQLGRLQSGLRTARRTASAAIRGIMNDLAQKYGRIHRALTGRNFQPNITACAQALPTVQIGCLRDFENNFRGILHGSTENSQMNIQIRGNEAAPGLPTIQCSGVKGCIATFQVVHQNVTREIADITEKRERDVRTFNQSVENFTNQMANGLRGMSASLDQRLQQMNAVMSSLGISPGVSINRVAPCPLETNEDFDGLVNSPSDLMCLVGGRMSPPMLNFAEDNFATALDGVAQKAQEANQQLNQVSTAMSAIAGLAQRCGTEEIERETTQFRTLVTQWNSGNCNYAREHCGAGGNQPISSLVSTIHDIDSSSSGANAAGDDPLASLSSGVAGLCTGYEEPEGDAGRGPASGGGGRATQLQELASALRSAKGGFSPLSGAATNPTDGSVSCPGVGTPNSVSIPSTGDPPAASTVLSGCQAGLPTSVPEACRETRNEVRARVTACLDAAIERANSLSTASERATGEHRVNVATCAGLYHDMESRAHRIGDASRRMNDAAGGAD